MPHLCLDPAKTYPPETKREFAKRLYLNRRSDADLLRRGVAYVAADRRRP
jgi:hypothetical protein